MWNYNYSDELYHFGVKGMKWGVRKKRDPRKKAAYKKAKQAYKEAYDKAWESKPNSPESKKLWKDANDKLDLMKNAKYEYKHPGKQRSVKNRSVKNNSTSKTDTEKIKKGKKQVDKTLKKADSLVDSWLRMLNEEEERRYKRLMTKSLLDGDFDSVYSYGVRAAASKDLARKYRHK